MQITSRKLQCRVSLNFNGKLERHAGSWLTPPVVTRPKADPIDAVLCPAPSAAAVNATALPLAPERAGSGPNDPGGAEHCHRRFGATPNKPTPPQASERRAPLAHRHDQGRTANDIIGSASRLTAERDGEREQAAGPEISRRR